jgi:glycosyltransferase involved in cell wall biosynthesis
LLVEWRAVRKSISAVIPTHNRRAHLLLAIESSLRQTREPLEVIVVADGCMDDTAEAVGALGDERIVLLDLPKAPGLGWENRNEALRRARGDAVAYLSDDDLWLPDHLERVGELLDAGVADVVQANACVVHPDGRLELSGTDWRVPEYRRRFLAGEEIRTPSSAIAHIRGVAEAAGGWRTVERLGDRDLWVRMLESGASTVATMEPTVLFFGARRGAPQEREQQARDYMAKLRDPLDLARLRAEISRVGLRFEADTRHALYERNDQHAALHERYGAALAELERLRERDATLTRVENGGWWRLRQRLEPLRRVADAARLTPTGRRRGCGGHQPCGSDQSNGIVPSWGSIRYLSGASYECGSVGKLMNTASVSPQFWFACHTPAGIRSIPGDSSVKWNWANCRWVGESTRPSNRTIRILPVATK